MLYATGHGGDGFLKFNDQFELAADELAGALRDAFALGRFAELLVLVDTCQAATLLTGFLLEPTRKLTLQATRPRGRLRQA